MSRSEFDLHVPLDRTAELSFDEVNDESVATLLNERMVVIKHRHSDVALDGLGAAYRWSRKRALPRRIAGRAIRAVGLGETMAYKRTRVSEIKGDPQNWPRHLRAAQPVIDELNDLNEELLGRPEIQERYGYRLLNAAILFISKGDKPGDAAFLEHQDNRGSTGLGFNPQEKPTLWRVHQFVPVPGKEYALPGAPVDFTFRTERGDSLVHMQRQGPAPTFVPFREGTVQYFRDGSVIHSGLLIEDGWRYGMGAFCEEVAETLV